MELTPREILRVKTKGTLNIVEESPLQRAVISAMKYYANQEVKNKWIKATDKLPDERDTVWVYNKDTGFVALGCVVYEDLVGEGNWYWAVNTGEDGAIYSEGNKIIAECMLDDNYGITHWCPLPELP